MKHASNMLNVTIKGKRSNLSITLSDFESWAISIIKTTKTDFFKRGKSYIKQLEAQKQRGQVLFLKMRCSGSQVPGVFLVFKLRYHFFPDVTRVGMP